MLLHYILLRVITNKLFFPLVYTSAILAGIYLEFVVLHGMFCAVFFDLVVFVLVKCIVELLYDMGTIVILKRIREFNFCSNNF